MAYALARGGNNKAFTQYERGRKDGSPDFVLGDDISVELSGCTENKAAGNELELTVDSDRFAVSVSGFDETRDVVVVVDPIIDDSPETESDA